MITKQDAKNYLNLMLKTENTMASVYNELASKISDVELQKHFLQMVKEEHDHARLVQELIALVDKWRED